MSYFDSCENCEVDFPKRQYVFAWCEKCLVSLTCRNCHKNMTMDDHRKSLYHDECISCFGKEQEQEIEDARLRGLQREALKTASTKYSGLSDSELESKWQSSANMIGMYAMKSWNCDPKDEQKFRDLAEEYQKEQSEIQKEITKRGR